MAIPQLLYVTSVLYTPDWVIEEAESLMFDFLWNNKKHHVKKEVVINEIKDGGKKMPLFSCYVKANRCTWVKRLVKHSKDKKSLAQSFIKYKNLSLDDIISSKLDSKYIQFKSKFYEQIFTNWFQIYSDVRLQNIMSTPLWHNRHILVDNLPVFYNYWKEGGIELFGHLLNEKGNIYSKLELEKTYNFAIKQMDNKLDAIPTISHNNK